MKIKDLLRNSRPFFTRNTRYLVVMFIFALAAFYSLRIVQDVAVTTADKKTPQEKIDQIKQVAALDGNTSEKIYSGKFDSQAGDYYRVIVRAEANQDTPVAIYAKSLFGVEKKIGEIVIEAGISVPYEQVFATDGIYRDIILRRLTKIDEENTSWDELKIYVFDVSVTRLDVASQAGALKLKPTIFGDTIMSLRYLPTTFSGKIDNSLVSGSRIVGGYFKPETSSISAVYAKFSIVGNGGIGQYEVEISEYDERGSGKMKTVVKMVFAADKLWKYIDKVNNGLYRFNMPAMLDKEKLYFVSFKSKNIVSDKENGLELMRFGGGKGGDGGSFIALGIVDYTTVGSGRSAARILSGATIQDIGNMYLYEYQMSHTERDLLDIYALQVRPKYDDALKMITLSETDGASLSYKIDTVYPFIKMNVLVKGIDKEKRGGFQVEYSFDEKNWQKVLPEDDVENGQEANFVINGQGAIATVYIRIAHYGKAQKNDILGLSDLHISALLKK